MHGADEGKEGTKMKGRQGTAVRSKLKNKLFCQKRVRRHRTSN